MTRSPLQFAVRIAAPSDAAELAELAARTFQETFAAGNRPEDLAAHLARSYGALQQGREIADPSIATLVVQVDESLAAYAQLRRGAPPDCVSGESRLEIWRFYVAQDWHGWGLAQALMQRVYSEAARLGAAMLWLGVWEHNPRAIAFYRKCGFEDVGSHVFTVGSDAQTDRIMVRPVVTT